MKREVLILKLEDKKAKLNAILHINDDKVRLPRKAFFSDLSRQVRIGRQTVAINAAIQVLKGVDIWSLDVWSIVLNSIAGTHSDKDMMLDRATSKYRNERIKALEFVFEHSLPIYRKQVCNELC